MPGAGATGDGCMILHERRDAKTQEQAGEQPASSRPGVLALKDQASLALDEEERARVKARPNIVATIAAEMRQ